MVVSIVLAFCALLASVAGRPYEPSHHTNPYVSSYQLRERSVASDNPLVVDLGYGIYNGTANSTTGINSWKGIRFAAPPTDGSQCPQSPFASGMPVAPGITGSEDCLFLNVFAPTNVSGPLPVLVWIHGGGYGQLNGSQDLTAIISANNNSFVGVGIQYRLGAFGFLSSQEVADNGIVNAGLYDQYFALQWVQQYITAFGGDPTRVTISGESAGGGSIMLLDIAYGGTLGNSLFQSSIAASPFLPMQHYYNDAIPTSAYNQFVELSGCSSPSGSKFDCLVAASTETLQNASSYVSGSGPYGTWAFLPVTDGSFIQDLPSRELTAGHVNGQHMLTGNNAVEGWLFLPKNLTTEADVVAWLHLTFPALSDTDVTAILAQYPIQDANITATSPRFATNGVSNPNANEVSPEATGQNQRAFNIYGESTFVCPSYWLAETYMNLSSSSKAYKYQYSVVPAVHGQDVAAYFDPPHIPHSPDFALAFKQIWGGFVTASDPSISNLVANGQSTGNASANPASSWPVFNTQTWPMMDLNETFTSTVTIMDQNYPATGIENAITLVNANTWEAGRGSRCEFWRSLGPMVPER